MKRYQPSNPQDAIPDEFQRLWDAIRRMHEAMARSVLPYGYEFNVDDDGSICIVRDGSLVEVCGGGAGDALTEADIEAICEQCGSVEGPQGPPGPAGPEGPAGPAGAESFIEHAKWMVD